MIKFAITGNIACGKSTAFKIVEDMGFPIIDCDNIVKSLYGEKIFISRVQEKFPFILKNMCIDFEILSSLLFSDNKFKSDFEMFIFPYVKEKIIGFFEENKKMSKVFVIVPILFEAGFDVLFDKIIFISADEKLRKKRLISRKSNLSNMAEKVINSQMSEDEKIIKCDYVIKNNGTLDEFKSAVENLLKAV